MKFSAALDGGFIEKLRPLRSEAGNQAVDGILSNILLRIYGPMSTRLRILNVKTQQHPTLGRRMWILLEVPQDMVDPVLDTGRRAGCEVQVRSRGESGRVSLALTEKRLHQLLEGPIPEADVQTPDELTLRQALLERWGDPEDLKRSDERKLLWHWGDRAADASVVVSQAVQVLLDEPTPLVRAGGWAQRVPYTTEDPLWPYCMRCSVAVQSWVQRFMWIPGKWWELNLTFVCHGESAVYWWPLHHAGEIRVLAPLFAGDVPAGDWTGPTP